MKLLSKLKSIYVFFRSRYHVVPTEDIVMAKTYEVKECQRDAEAKKRVNAAFDAQEKEMNLRAMKAHSCEDPNSCVKRICFKRTPDKIKSKEYKVKKSTQEVIVD